MSIPNINIMFFKLKIRAMKIVLTATFLFNLNLLEAQEQKLKFNWNNASVKQALEDLKNQTGYSLWFNVNDIDLRKKISVLVNDKTISETLNIILADQNLEFETKGKFIRIYKKEVLLNNVITGTIVDDYGEPLPGVNVMFKEIPEKGTITDIDGKFSIKIPEGVTKIFISYIGMKSVEYSIKSVPAKIVLSADEKTLQEVVDAKITIDDNPDSNLLGHKI